MKIGDFKADDQETLEEKQKQIEDEVKLSTSTADNVDESEVDVDGKSLNKENLEQIQIVNFLIMILLR